VPNSVLIIDDEPGIALALMVRFQNAGYLVHQAATGLDGLDAARKQRPDVIILDIRLPDIDGYEVCRRLKSDPAVSDIPIVYLSANANDQSRTEAMASGGGAFLAKPFNASDIIEVVGRLCLQPAVNEESPSEH
jgi:CheY-like chemotaxis protein